MMKQSIKIIALFLYVLLVLNFEVKASLPTYLYENPNVTISPDGEAFTTDYLVQGTDSIPVGYTIELEKNLTLEKLKTGEHYYYGVKDEDVTISKWVVGWHTGQCIHNKEGIANYHDVYNSYELCYSYYYPGWHAYCSDCGEIINEHYIYMSESTASTLTMLPSSACYYYSCPWCLGLEQGAGYTHVCKIISVNKYQISYESNTPWNSVVTGTMKDTLHMYDNYTEYEGISAASIYYTDTKLRKNIYVCQGYEFVGWNTSPDGSGKAYSDEQEVINLSLNDGETIVLYAQWQTSRSTLQIDPCGGSYNGESAIYSVTQNYLTSYKIDLEEIVAPEGYTVTFDALGGDALESIYTYKTFDSWIQETELLGRLLGNTYYFTAPDGNEERIVATYVDVAYQLPIATKEGFSFVGWYEDEDLTIEYGKYYEYKVAHEDITLYAKWAPLLLEATENYIAQNGVGAVDLSWLQEDGKANIYKLFQSTDLSAWNLIEEKIPYENQESQTVNFNTTTSNKQYEVLSSGYYEINLLAAQGGSYASKSGGQGGEVTTSVWLEAGSVVAFDIGSMPGTNAGGGATAAYLINGTSKTLIAGAGGGGGANAQYAGGSGGIIHDVRETTDASGGGGGEGFPSGSNGIYTEGVTDMITITSSTLSVYGYYSTTSFGTPGYELFTYTIYGSEVINGKTYMKLKKTSGETIYFYWKDSTDFGDLTSTNLGTASFSNGVLTYYYTSHSAVYGHTTVGYHSMKGTVCNGLLYFYTKEETPGSYLASEGGSNYVNANLITKETSLLTGVNKGNGSASISWVDAGYIEDTKMSGVLAKDEADPDMISNYYLNESEDSNITISWEAPIDSGSVYYHKAESYYNQSGVLTKISDSNITTTNIETGVQGYYYTIDSKSDTQVDGMDLYTINTFLTLSFSDDEKYLHIAAVDGASNVAETIHIKIPSADSEDVIEYFEPGTLYTKPLEIRTVTDGVYQVDSTTYFIRADGITEYELVLQGYIEGEVSEGYQIEKLVYQLQDGLAMTSLVIPTSAILNVEEITYDNAQIDRYEDFAMLEGFQTTYASATRGDYMSFITGRTGIKVQPTLDGTLIMIYPSILATYESIEYISSVEMDKGNAIGIYPDAEPPNIMGIEALENIDIMELTNEAINIEISASDSGSGLKELAIHIKNRDNGLEETFLATDGTVKLSITKESALFLGDIEITFIAIDQVGNINTNGGDGFAFSLTSELERAREPIDDSFKEGDGAVLKIETRGYVDLVTITFPDTFVEHNPSINHIYEYEFPYLMKEEEYIFNIPLGVDDEEYEILITAYKNDEVLYSKESLFVVSGTVLDELRTRVRDY